MVNVSFEGNQLLNPNSLSIRLYVIAPRLVKCVSSEMVLLVGGHGNRKIRFIGGMRIQENR